VLAILVWSAGADPADRLLLAEAGERDLRGAAQPVLRAHLRALHGAVAALAGFFRALGNSAIITALATVIAVFASLLAGYAYSRFRSRWLAVPPSC
jgi:ABC-type glycerol-3-phosphate transport system permease component